MSSDQYINYKLTCFVFR